MIKENNYIQLPPLRRDTDLKVVMALWEYVKMPEESRQKVLAFLDESEKYNPSGELGKPVHFRLVLLPVGVQIGEGGDVMLRHIAYLCGNLIQFPKLLFHKRACRLVVRAFGKYPQLIAPIVIQR